MKRIVDISASERQNIFQICAQKMNIPTVMVEKDFWVCWVLSKIFGDAELGRMLRFKGGTSLSKAFHLISRFSEDVDLILDWRLITGDDPMKVRSNAQQDKFNKQMQEDSAKYISTDLKERVSSVFSGICQVKVDNDDGHVLWIEYPAEKETGYILPRVKLEIGPLASWVPHKPISIIPYIGEAIPQLMISSFQVPTIVAERTFWEKITILHQEHFRPETLVVPSRFSRHYYDVFMMSRTSFCSSALNNVELLKKVVQFKQKFYPRAWARYDLAYPGQLQLLPPEHSQRMLARDYDAMRLMIFGDYPAWSEILTGLRDLEERINL